MALGFVFFFEKKKKVLLKDLEINYCAEAAVSFWCPTQDNFTYQKMFLGCSHLEALNLPSSYRYFGKRNIPFDLVCPISFNLDLKLLL